MNTKGTLYVYGFSETPSSAGQCVADPKGDHGYPLYLEHGFVPLFINVPAEINVLSSITTRLNFRIHTLLIQRDSCTEKQAAGTVLNLLLRVIMVSVSEGMSSPLDQGLVNPPSHRRKCPGQYLGAKSIWIAIVRLLWAFKFERRNDISGNPTHVDPENCTSGMTSLVSSSSSAFGRPVQFSFQEATGISPEYCPADCRPRRDNYGVKAELLNIKLRDCDSFSMCLVTYLILRHFQLL
jgi:hypothetical protein